SLKSNDPKKIKSYCTFLQTIVFNDFPAEIFIQRSSILKIIIDLTIKFTHHESDEDNSLLKCLISCFNYYTTKLIKRIKYIKDPATFCYKDFYSNGYDYFSKSIILNYTKKQDTSRSINSNTSLYSVESEITSTISTIKSSIKSSNQSSLKIGTTTNAKLKTSLSQSTLKKTQKSSSSLSQNSPRYSLELKSDIKDFEEDYQDIQESIETFLSETNNENYETDLNSMHVIRQEQEWPLYSFCFKLFDCLLDNINLILMKNNNGMNQLDTSILPMICETINNLILILNETKTEWSSSKLLNELFINLFNKLNFNIRFLINKMEKLSDEQSKYLNVTNRVLYVFLVDVLSKVIKLVYSIDESSVLIPSELAETIFIIVNDICLSESFKSLNSILPNLLVNLDKNLFDIYELSKEICDSMKNACQFMQKWNHQQISKETLIIMAKKSLNYMDYHASIDLANKIIEFSSNLMSLDKESESFKSDIEYLVTGCMMSKNDLIRLETYSTIYRIVNVSINYSFQLNLT
ncbi:unnamed protein product, partial [Brachionus calyciflorus]